MNTNIRHTHHSAQRAAQRGIHNNAIKTLIKDGSIIRKQGLKFYYMTRNNLNYYDPNEQKYLQSLVVVMASDSNTVITCYKHKDGIKKIKRKSKYLVKH